LPVSPTAAALATSRGAAVDMLTQRLGISAERAARSLDVQARGGNVGGKLLEKLGRGLSQVSFDNYAARYVVALSPTGDAVLARSTLDALGFDSSEAVIERGEIDYVEHQQLAETVAKRVSAVVEAGRARVTAVVGGVEITLGASASPDERRIVDDAAGLPHVTVAPSTATNVTAEPVSAACGPARTCDAVRGGSYWYDGVLGCTLGWWAGAPGMTYPNAIWFLTAGHCFRPGGAPWNSCNAVPTYCGYMGGEAAGEFGPGDNALIAVQNGWAREPGYTDWRDGSRQPITYLPGYWDYNQLANQVVCHGGVTTGFSCGIVAGVSPPFPVAGSSYYGPTTLSGMVRVNYICMQPGDSGGPVFTADMRGAVGVVSSSSDYYGCNYGGWFEGIKRMHDNYGLLPYAG